MNKFDNTKKSVLFVVTSNNVKGNTGIATGFNLAEVTHPLEKLENAGFNITIASIKGGAAPLDGLEDMADAVNKKYWNDSDFRHAIENTVALKDVDTKAYDAIFFAGGHGTMWDFPDNANVHQAIRDIYEKGGIVSAVCHGPAALVNVRLNDNTYLVADKQVAAFTDSEEAEVQATDIVPFLLSSTLQQHGAKLKDSPNWSDNVVVDGRLITGQNPQSAASLGVALANALNA